MATSSRSKTSTSKSAGSISSKSSSTSAGSSYGGFGSAPSASVSKSISSSPSSTSSSINNNSNTISVKNFANPNFSSSPTFTSIPSSGNISSLGQSNFATINKNNTGLAAVGLSSIYSGLNLTSNQSIVGETASKLNNVLSSFIGPINQTTSTIIPKQIIPTIIPRPTIITKPTLIPEALIPDKPTIQPQPFTVIDLTDDSKNTPGDIPENFQEIPNTLTKNISKYLPFLLLGGIILLAVKLVKA